MRGFKVGVLIFVGSACSQSPNGEHSGSAGDGAVAGAGTVGTAGTSSGVPGSGTGGTGGSGTTVVIHPNGGAASATIPLNPPASVSLSACKSVSDDGSSTAYGNCIDCCFSASFTEGGFFAGTCACSIGVEDTSVCGSQSASSDQCNTCCLAADYYGSGTVPGGGCTCRNRKDPNVCALTNSAADCAVCCINAGYVMSSPANDACVCSNG
ncbi:MAG TPA: hypothetical protein VMI54_01940 [Polyangiaceae bacterium]|nr:hypothetical protein [Polyangiaceae bacterium]